MIKLILVDDEEWVSIGFKLRVNIAQLGMELSGTAMDGKEAMELVEKVRPDIVITDIQMPVMDGIMLMDYLHSKYPEIIIIVISGYSDFEYARKAISYNALQYILKPIDWAEMESTLRNAALDIEKQRQTKKEEISLRKKIHEHKQLYFDKVLTDLVLNPHNELDNISETFKKIDSSLAMEAAAVLLIKIHNSLPSAEDYFEEASCDFNDIFYYVSQQANAGNYSGIVFKLFARKNEIAVILGIRDASLPPYDYYKHILKWAGIINSSFSSKSGLQMYIGIGHYISLELLYSSYLQAASALNYAEFTRRDTIVQYDELPDQTGNNPFWGNKEKELIYYLENGNLQKANTIIDVIFNPASILGINPQDFKNSILELVIAIGRMMRGYDKLLHDVLESNEAYMIIFEACTMDELKQWFTNICLKVTEWITTKHNVNGRKIVDEIISYLDNNYFENINLNSFADKYHFSAAYISKIFKNYTGENFSDYLSKTRILKAADLLKSPELKLYSISEMVGYENVNYFLKKFKEYFGCTPSEYKKMK